MAQHPSNGGIGSITQDDVRAILHLRLLLARAANKDSLAWWDDESFTPHAGFLLERIFPVVPDLAARSLALSAALARHQGACANHDNALHLYRLDLDGQDALAVRSVPLLTIAVPQGPIGTLDALKQKLLDLLVEPAPYTVVRRYEAGGLLIKIPSAPAGTAPLLHRAQTLAWAYLEGVPGHPVFPFAILEPTKELSF